MLYQLVFFIVVTQAIPIQPSPTKVKHVTILDKMRADLSSSCSFPPKDVLDNHNTESLSFLEDCDKVVPNSNSKKDRNIVLCTALYDVGVRICGVNETTHNRISSHMPHNSSEFEKLVTEGLNRRHPDLCQSLKAVFVEPKSEITQNWTLRKVLDGRETACGRLCFDYNENENVFCQLILWGSQLLNDHSTTVGTGVHGSLQDQTGHADSTSLVADPQKPVEKIEGDFVEPQVNGQTLLANPNENNQQTFQTNANGHHNIPDKIVTHKSDQLVSADQHENNEYFSSKSNMLTSSAVSGPDTKVPIVEINESVGKSAKTTRHQSSENTGPKGSVNSVENVVNNLISSNTGTASKPGLDNLNSKPQIDEPVIKKEDADKESTKSSIQAPKSVMKTVSTESNGGVMDPIDELPAPNEGGDNIGLNEGGENNGLNEEMGADQFGNEQLANQGDEEDDMQMNSDLNFEQPIKSQTIDHNNFGKSPQEEMTNGIVPDRFDDADSHFFSYFVTMVILCIVCYLVFHNKQKILALALEGRSRRGSRRRPNTANYHKLDSNLEEAVSSPCNTTSSHVIY